MLVSDAPPPPQRTAGAKRSALAPAARDRRDQNFTVHPKREPRGSKNVHQNPKKLTSRSLKTDRTGVSKPPAKSRTEHKNERVVQLTQQQAGPAKNQRSKKGLPAARSAPSDRKGARTNLQNQKAKALEERDDRNLAVRLHKSEGVPLLGTPKSAKLNSRLPARKQTNGAAS